MPGRLLNGFGEGLEPSERAPLERFGGTGVFWGMTTSCFAAGGGSSSETTARGQDVWA